MTRVALLLGTLTPGHVGGSETYVSGLLGAYAAGHGPAETVVVAHRPALEALRVSDGPAPHVWGHLLDGAPPPAAGPARAAWLLRALASARRDGRRLPPCSVAHAALTIPAPRPAAPLVLTLHDVAHHVVPQAFTRGERLFRAYAYDAAARRAALVVTVSEHARGDITARLGVPAERVVAIPHGLDHARWRPEPDERDRERLGRLELPERFVLYPANLWPHKNHDRLVLALGRTADPDLRLVLTGRSQGRLRELHETAARAGVRDRVAHVGYVPGDTLAALYRCAAAVVFPSLHEGFGAPPLEAMACGCPVAASEGGAVGEACADAALTFDPSSEETIAAAIDRVTGDDALRAELRDRGLQRAATFTWEAAARAHAAAYERVAEA
jgi:glycosyltransferase involved in cell wall biosynthesis